MQEKVKVVLHEAFGGFSLTPRMIEMLKERGCEWVSHCAQASPNGNYFLPSEFQSVNKDDVLRRDPHLIAVIEELMVEYDEKTNSDEGWEARSELHLDLLANLKVVEVTVSIDVLQHDGRESIEVTGGLW